MAVAEPIIAEFDSLRADTLSAMSRRKRLLAGILAAVFAYLGYAWLAFDVSGLLAKAEPDRAVILGTDSVAYKVHVTKNLRRDETTVAIEGERTSEYQTPPDWVELSPERTVVDLGEGYWVTIEGDGLTFDVPGYGAIVSRVVDKRIETIAP